MKKALALASATLLLSSLAGVAGAHHKDDHTANYHGLCTAAFSGSETGQEKKSGSNAFATFIENAGDMDGDEDVDRYDLAQFCLDMTGGYGNPGQGNDPEFLDSTCGFEEDQCNELDDRPGGTDPGSSNGKDKGGDA